MASIPFGLNPTAPLLSTRGPLRSGDGEIEVEGRAPDS